MRRIKSLILRLPHPILKRIYHVYDYYAYPEVRETRMSFGTRNPSITFYVIRPISHSNEGLMSLLLNVCRHIIYAEQHNYVPVVDFKNYSTQYTDDRGTNIWEDYFYQPANYSLEEVYQSKNVILSGLKPIREITFEPQVRFDEEQIALARSIIRKYVKMKPEVIELVDKETNRLNPQKSIGLYLRGTDYVGTKPIGHYIQPTFDEAKEAINKWDDSNKKNVFLVTEDNRIYLDAKSYYKDRLTTVSFDSFISDYQENELLFESNSINQISESAYERGLFYLVKTIVLSKCSYLFGGNTCGSWAAVAFSDEGSVINIYDNGTYK